jgi:hypothetical protein
MFEVEAIIMRHGRIKLDVNTVIAQWMTLRQLFVRANIVFASVPQIPLSTVGQQVVSQ